MFLTHPTLAAPRITHGFFTRSGGVSEGVYASLNCGPGSNDAPERVAENRGRCAGAFGLAPESLLTAYQVHSPDVLVVDATFAERPKVDALVTKTQGLMLGILTADCAPVLFADVEAGVIGAAHAGWKGAIGGVLENTVAAMESLGAKRAHIRAVVGPCIAQASYEVGEEFRDNFITVDVGYGTFFTPTLRGSRSAKGDGLRGEEVASGGWRVTSVPPTEPAAQKFLFNLPAFVAHRLRACGLINVEDLAMDTCADEARFFSYRRKTLRNEPDYARQLSAIVLK